MTDIYAGHTSEDEGDGYIKDAFLLELLKDTSGAIGDFIDQVNAEDLTLALSGVEPEALDRYKERLKALKELKEQKEKKDIKVHQRRANFDAGKGSFRRSE